MIHCMSYLVLALWVISTNFANASARENLSIEEAMTPIYQALINMASWMKVPAVKTGLKMSMSQS